MKKNNIEIIEKSKPAKPKSLKKKVKRDVAKVLNKNSLVQKSLLAMNPYLMSLLDPFNMGQARIPDLVMYPSCPISVVHRDTLTVNAGGVCGSIYGLCTDSAALPQTMNGSFIPLVTANVGATANYYPIGMRLSATSTTANLTLGAIDTNWYQLRSFTYGGEEPIPELFTKLRLVSAGFNIQYTGTALDSKGKITAVFCPRNTIREYCAKSTTTALTLDYLSQQPGARIIPVNILTGATVLYNPLDNVSLQYADIGPNNSNGTSTFEWDNILSQYCGGEVFLLVDGATSGASFQVTSVFNYEAIPMSNAFDLVNATPSPSDPIALSHAINVVQKTPNVVASSAEELGVSSGAIVPKNIAADQTKSHVIREPIEQPSMFDKVLGGIGTFTDGAIKVVDKVAPLASKIIDMFL